MRTVEFMMRPFVLFSGVPIPDHLKGKEIFTYLEAYLEEHFDDLLRYETAIDSPDKNPIYRIIVQEPDGTKQEITLDD